MTAQIKEEKLKCPDCSKEYSNNFDKFSIQGNGRCVDCERKYLESHPELDSENKHFRFYYTVTLQESEDIYAKDEDAAREKFLEQVDYDDLDISEIVELDRTKK